MKKIENHPVEIAVAGKFPGFEPGLHVPLRGLLRPNLVTVAPLRLPNRVLHPTKCDAHPGESIFQTCSKALATAPIWIVGSLAIPCSLKERLLYNLIEI